MSPHSLLLFLTGIASVVHASTWIEVSSPRFEIVTDAGEAAARELVTGLEQFDAAITHSIGPSPAIGPATGRLRIYLFRSEHEFAEFRSDGWVAGLTMATNLNDSPVVALFAGPATRETAIHEYIHALVRRGDWKLPHWFEEGLAEFYSRSTPLGKGDQLSIGRRIPEHLAQLRNQSLTASTFVEEPRSDAHLRYYAASWAMVHMLLMEPRYRPQTERLLAEGTWDASFPQLLKDLQEYVARPIWKEAAVDAPRVRSSLEMVVRTIASLDAEFMLAGLLLDVNRPEAALKRYKKIAAAHPRDAAGAEAAGFAALADGQTALAKVEFLRAVRLQSVRARVWAESAALDLEAGAAWADVKPVLERAASLDPSDYRPAFLLGVRESDEGNFAQAVVHLASAGKAAPGQADVWHAYAFALSKVGRLADARIAAKRAIRVASTAEWEKMASDLLASLERADVSSGPLVRQKPTVVTSPAWSRPKPDAEVEGQFLEFVCDAKAPRFRIEVEGGKIVELRVGDPTQVMILNPPSGESSTDLKCGQQNHGFIRVGYRKSDSTVLEVKFPQVHDSKQF